MFQAFIHSPDSLYFLQYDNKCQEEIILINKYFNPSQKKQRKYLKLIVKNVNFYNLISHSSNIMNQINSIGILNTQQTDQPKAKTKY